MRASALIKELQNKMVEAGGDPVVYLKHEGYEGCCNNERCYCSSYTYVGELNCSSLSAICEPSRKRKYGSYERSGLEIRSGNSSIILSCSDYEKVV